MDKPTDSTTADHRANFAPMPTTRQDWSACYYVPVTFDHLEPRACKGETLVFSKAQTPKRGDLVCVRGKHGDTTGGVLVGVLVALGPKAFRLALSLDGSCVVPGTLATFDVHPAIGVLSTRLDTAEGRDIARANAEKRRIAA